MLVQQDKQRYGKACGLDSPLSDIILTLCRQKASKKYVTSHNFEGTSPHRQSDLLSIHLSEGLRNVPWYGSRALVVKLSPSLSINCWTEGGVQLCQQENSSVASLESSRCHNHHRYQYILSASSDTKSVQLGIPPLYLHTIFKFSIQLSDNPLTNNMKHIPD